MDSLSVTYVPRQDATPEAEQKAVANVYRFILKRCDRKESVEQISTPSDCDVTDDGTNPNLSRDRREAT